jgi:hypothetical protein
VVSGCHVLRHVAAKHLTGGTAMKRLTFLLLSVLAMAAFASVVFVPGAYALGHGEDPYRIPGTVPGCNVCHDFADPNSTYDGSGSNPNLRWIRQTIDYKGTHTVVFTSLNQLADGVPPYQGPCEVCHTTTLHHRNDGSDNTEHYDGQDDCILCHPHFLDDITSYFEVRFVGGQSHETHLASYGDPKGPGITDCTDCHLGAPDYSIFNDNKPLETTHACDECHSPGTAPDFDGVGQICQDGYDGYPACESDPAYPNWVAYGAKQNWVGGIYNEAQGDALKTGKEKWCFGCHDDNAPSHVNGVDAPKVMGNNATYGFNVTGHGEYGVLCTDCHALTYPHTDGLQRTYVATSSNPALSYQSGYRLKESLAVPRDGEVHPAAFRLCANTGCHLYTDITSPDTSHFIDKNRYPTLTYHTFHLEFYPDFPAWDSDVNGTADSAMTCPACHQPHGSQSPAMMRSGELIGKYPALDFHWYQFDGVTPTTEFSASYYGEAKCGNRDLLLAINGVCVGCHPEADPPDYLIRYYRAPDVPVGLQINNVWTTDYSNILKTSFVPLEPIRYHVSFTITGPATSYFIRSPKTKSTAFNTSGAAWITYLQKADTLAPGIHEWTWDETIPSGATLGSGAKVKIMLRMYDYNGGTKLKQVTKQATFDIGP